MCVGTVRTSIKQWSFQGLNHSLCSIQFSIALPSKQNGIWASWITHTCTVVLALLPRPLAVFYRQFAYQLGPYSQQPLTVLVPTSLLGGTLLTPGKWPPVCWGGAQIYGPVSAKSPTHSCAINVLAVHKTWTQYWRFHLARISKKLPGFRSWTRLYETMKKLKSQFPLH